MLQLRPNCEFCNKDLPPHSDEACICTYECTFCRSCVEDVLKGVCPNCGGNFVDRPIRPSIAFREGTSLQHQPASTERVHTKYTKEQLHAFSNMVKEKL